MHAHSPMQAGNVVTRGMPAIELTREEAEILRHTARRTANGLYCGDSKAMRRLVELGAMESAGRASWCVDEFFRMTSIGRGLLNVLPRQQQ